MTSHVEFPQSRCWVGIARGDITPPVGIYHRMWGAATHDQSTGIHRPLTATVLYCEPTAEDDSSASPVVSIAIDHCLFWIREMEALLNHVGTQANIDRDRIAVFFSHTHAAGLMGLERQELPGGDLIPEYLDRLSRTVANLVNEAKAALVPGSIVYGKGQSDLATNRDYFDEENGHAVCGFNPGGVADQTVLVGRISDDTGQVLGTIVNYACHPTTLAWDNTLISPDYVGAMREVVETATEAPCLFVQGASGDIGPREGFVGDVEVADKNGRRLGYAVLSALESLAPANTRFQYQGPVVSGATIGTWDWGMISEQRQRELSIFETAVAHASLKYRADLPDREQLTRERNEWQQKEESAKQAGDDVAARDARAMIERRTRRLTRVEFLPEGDAFPYEARLWRIGDAVWVILNGEHYNSLQRDLRAQFPHIAIIVGTLANGSEVWYLPDEQSYGKGLYQEDASILAQGSLETLTTAVAAKIEEMFPAS